MKKVLSSLTVLFAAALLIYSCNPVDEDQLPPSNTTQLTTTEARQMLQGSWYFYKSESVNGPICAGGPNETKTVYTYDLQYAGFKVEFTNFSGGVDPQYGIDTYNMYYGGGNGTEGYNVFTNDDESFSAFTSFFNLQDGELYLWFELIFLEGYGIDGGGKIVSLTDEDLVLFNASYQRLYFFKRSNQTSQPYNVPGLAGNFVLDNYKEINSGVVDVNEAVPNGTTYSFNNEIYHVQTTKRVKYKGTQSGGAGSLYSLNLAPADPAGFSYEVSSTHLFSEIAVSGGSVWSSYKIVELNANELVLRNETSCNAYKEYHLTKVN